MRDELHTEDPGLQRMEQAAEWLQRMHIAEQDERVVEEWLDWCQRDPLNQLAFDEMAAVWELAGRIPAAPRVIAPRPKPPRRWALAASLAGLTLATVVGVWWNARLASVEILTREYASPVGVNSSQTLADGSLLELGGGTRVTVAIGPRERRVELHDGELFVTVRKDPGRPFLVDVGRLEVIATGTAFNVQRTDNRTTVTVAEGSVKALYEGQLAAAPNVHVQSEQELVYSHASRRFDVRNVKPEEAIAAWRTGKLNFKNAPLSEVIATLNRYTPEEIVIEDPQVRTLSITGAARADGIEDWLQGLPISYSVAVVKLADGRRVIRPRPDATND